MKHQKTLTWLVIAIILVLAALACSLPFNLGGTSDQPESEPIPQPDQDFDLDIDLGEFDLAMFLADLPGTTIPLEMGASVFVPEGALPPDTAIDSRASEVLPLLPEGFEPVGDALVITADAQPQSPVLLRLPIPPGIDDPASLMIVRVEPDGLTTFLMSHVDGDELLAFTPGFSKFCVIEVAGKIMREQKIRISGGGPIFPGELITIQVAQPIIKPSSMRHSKWTVSGPATIVYQDEISMTIKAGDQGGLVRINYSGLYLDWGVRVFDSSLIRVLDERQIERRKGIEYQSFHVSVTSPRPQVYEGHTLDVQVSFHGHYRLPVLWTYELDECHQKTEMITSDHQPVPLSFDCPPGSYFFYVYATYLDVKEIWFWNNRGLTLSVVERPLEVFISGPTELEWEEPGVKANFTAEATGGAPKEAGSPTLYDFSWRMLPGGEWVSSGLSDMTITDQEYHFAAPGDYLVQVRVKNQDGVEVYATLPVLVRGEEPLNAHVLEWPIPIEEEVEAKVTFRIRGGTIILGGRMGQYAAEVFWGDGTSQVVQPKDFEVKDGATYFTLSHSWEEAKTYTVMLFVEDLTGTIAYAEADIVVGEKSSGVFEGELIAVIGDWGVSEPVPDSFVKITRVQNTVTAYIEFEFFFGVGSGDHSCITYEDLVYQGEGTISEDQKLLIEMKRTDYGLRFEGNACGDDEDGLFTGASILYLEGDFDEEGVFQGIFNSERREGDLYFLITATMIEE